MESGEWRLGDNPQHGKKARRPAPLQTSASFLAVPGGAEAASPRPHTLTGFHLRRVASKNARGLWTSIQTAAGCVRACIVARAHAARLRRPGVRTVRARSLAGAWQNRSRMMRPRPDPPTEFPTTCSLVPAAQDRLRSRRCACARCSLMTNATCALGLMRERACACGLP